MRLRTTKDLKVTFLGIIPVLQDYNSPTTSEGPKRKFGRKEGGSESRQRRAPETGVLNPQEIVSLSGLLTFKGKSIQKLLKESLDKGENLQDKIRKILMNSSLKGHASMATTPVLCFSFEASKFLDSALTGLTFSSALMASGRRTSTTPEDIVFPTAILKDPRASKIYYQTSKENIDFLNFLLSKNVNKDEASKILQYGIYGTGILQLPLESIVSFAREYQVEKGWMPEEAGFLLSQIEKKLKEYGADLLYITRLIAPRDTYPYPNIFKEPAKTNLVRDLVKKKKTKDPSEIISADILPVPGLKKELAELEKKMREAAKNKKEIKNYWQQILLRRRQICRDYNSAIRFKTLSRVSWRVWGDKKRHRTCPMIVESVYYSIDRARKVFKKYGTQIRAQIKNKKINERILKKVEEVFSLPPTVRSNPEFRQRWLERALDSLETYQGLINLGVKERDAIFVIPRGIKIDVLQEYDLFNLISGYYPLRICSTVEEELRRLTLKEVSEMKKMLEKKGLDWLARHIMVKCHTAGFCLEREFCGIIKSLIKDYDEETHKALHRDLEKKFQGKFNLLK